jgi:hypothetical protein
MLKIFLIKIFKSAWAKLCLKTLPNKFGKYVYFLKKLFRKILRGCYPFNPNYPVNAARDKRCSYGFETNAKIDDDFLLKKIKFDVTPQNPPA